MTALVLTAAAGAAASSFGITGTAASLITAGAAVAGRAIDLALLSRPTVAEGPRLDELEVTASREGAPIRRIYGRMKTGGQVIWATHLEEVRTTISTGGGKGAPQSKQVDYAYYGNFAVALGEGPLAHLGRIWVDGEELDQTSVTFRFHKGSDTQAPDPLIQAKEGPTNAPAYRGVAYVVFERLPLADYNNRIPQLTFEVYRPVGTLEAKIEGVDIIPGAGEFAYEPSLVRRTDAEGESVGENRTTSRAVSDWTASLDELQALCPNVASAALVVTWFGTDLRAGSTEIEPRVDRLDKTTAPLDWSVAGLTRQTANAVSTVAGVPAFGGTPNDASVVAAIRDLKDRGIGCVFYPFIMMDIPAGNGLSDPYGEAEQAVYPWRGRMTCDPAPGMPGTPDKTGAAAAQITSLVGTVEPGNFVLSGDTVNYSGPPEWSYRRMILHYAWLCKAAGGVDAFAIGSEFVGLTQVRSAETTYPFVDALVALAADVREILGASVRIGYAADWSEYHSHRPGDGSGDVLFNMDPLWSDPNIDFIGIDNYLPVADWRDGSTHADATGFPTVASPHDPAYLKAQVEGGEGYDWYYATPNDRDAQTRTPIIDSASGKDWVFRQKDIRNWWLSAHHDRPAGLEAATPTPWQPQSKPIWLTEIGCPAIEKGANQPNVFHDPKSSESFFPRYSSGARDDVAQRRTVETIIDYWSSGSGQNPVSNVYGAPMVDTARTHVWAWDARSFPAFPADTTLWADALNWDRGHWLNGRLGTAPSDGLVAHIMTDAGFAPDQWETHLWDTTIDGFAVERVMSVRDALDPLEHALGITGFESGGRIVFIGRRGRPVAALDAGSLVDTASDSEAVGLVEEVRAQETELPAAIQLTVLEPLGTYASVTVDARRPVDVGTGASRRVSSSTLPLALAPEMAQSLAEQWLHAALTRRARQSFALPPSALRFEPGDIISLEVAGGSGDRTVRIEAISDGAARSVASVSHDAAHLAAGPILRRKDYAGDSAVSGPPTFCFLDLPLLSSDDTDGALYAAAYAKPWDDGVALYRAPGTAGYALEGTITDPAGMGRTLSAWRSGPRAQWDRATTLDIIMPGRTLQSAPDLLVFDGANGFAIETAPEVWEVFQAADIELIGAGTYRLSRLLRAQLGTDPGLEVIPPEGVPTGARIIALDSTVHTQRVATDRIGVAANWRFGPANKAVSDSTYTSLVHTPAGVAARPYAPAQLRALRQTGGDIAISWTRRTRRGGDGWQLVDVPLGEDVEAYEIDIFDGPSVVRTIAAFGPGASYTAAQQLADFGALPPAVTLHVFQMSATIGRGAPREIHVEF